MGSFRQANRAPAISADTFANRSRYNGPATLTRNTYLLPTPPHKTDTSMLQPIILRIGQPSLQLFNFKEHRTVANTPFTHLARSIVVPDALYRNSSQVMMTHLSRWGWNKLAPKAESKKSSLTKSLKASWGEEKKNYSSSKAEIYCINHNNIFSL